MKIRIILAVLLIQSITSLITIYAQTPQLLNYQGKLTNKDGTSASGTFVMIFSLYSNAEGGTALWDETQNVAVTNGIFNVLLGSVRSFADTLFAAKGNRYLGIRVGTEPEMQPRFQLTSVAYAMHANSARTLSVSDGDPKDPIVVDSNGNVGIGTNKPEHKLQINANQSDVGLRLHNPESSNNTNTPYLMLSGGYSPYNGVALRGVGDNVYGRKALVFYAGWDGNTDTPGIDGLKERMRIESNGKVGIGTTNPQKMLHIDCKGVNNSVIIQNCPAWHVDAREVLNNVPNRTIIIGGTEGSLLWLYWRDGDKRYRISLVGNEF